MTPEQRSSAQNGIWLCQTDAKLVDNDPALYTVELLHQWKNLAETRRREMLTSGAAPEVGLDLVIPSLDSSESLLSFANTRIPYVDHGGDLEELQAFLESDLPFAWWLLTGPGGVGKSRLAVELCRRASPYWHAGFLREPRQSRLSDVESAQPTLIVVDYASQRSGWLGEALAELSQRVLSSKVRVLILERDAAGPWWETVQRHDRMEESALIASHMYALPRTISGFDREDARELVNSTAVQLGCTDLSTTQIEDVIDAADNIDPDGRPLFIQIATMDWLDAHGKTGGRDDAIRRLMTRSILQMAKRAGDDSITRLATNAQIFTTAVGGLSLDEYAAFSEDAGLPPGLLPKTFEVLGSLTLDDLVDGIRPDIIGELFALDQAGSSGTTQRVTMTLLKHASLKHPDAYRGFVERAAADHPDHPNLVDLLAAAISDESPLLHLEIGVAIIPKLRRSDHEVIGWILERLSSDAAFPDAGFISRLLTTARFHVANLLMHEDNTSAAHELYSAALAECDPTTNEYGSILNNRGITLIELERPEDAIVDFTAVIEASSASDESRACALNNRADLLTARNDLNGAIRDRSAVLQLADTTYNRRYIALVRRAIALRLKGDEVSASEDISAILATDDIAVEQKMAARLQLAEWLLDAGEITRAQTELGVITASRRNFSEVAEKAAQLREQFA